MTEEEKRAEVFFRHSLGLMVRYDFGTGSTERITLCSGFLAEIEGHWFLVTAGHVIEEWNQVVKKGGRFIESSIYDTWSHDDPYDGHPIPYAFEPEKTGFVDFDGIDFAILPIEGLVRDLVARGRVRPVMQRHWTLPVEFSGAPTYYAVIGNPFQFEHINRDGPAATGLEFHPSVVFMEPCERPEEMQDHPHRGYGRLEGYLNGPSGPLTDMRGLSGSPVWAVFEFEDGRPSLYWVVGIYSSWHPRLRVLAFTEFFGIAETLARRIRRARYNAASEALKRRMIEETAYYRWLNSSRSDSAPEEHWLAALFWWGVQGDGPS